MKRLKCFFYGHKPHTEKVISAEIRELKCSCCLGRFNLNVTDGSLVRLNKKQLLENEILAAEYADNWNKKRT